MAEFQLRVNGRTRVVDAASAMPLRYVSMNDLELQWKNTRSRPNACSPHSRPPEGPCR